MKQLALFIDPDAQPVKVNIFREEETYRAEIQGGWWTARGRTAKQAAANVMKRYSQEREYFPASARQERPEQIGK